MNESKVTPIGRRIRCVLHQIESFSCQQVRSADESGTWRFSTVRCTTTAITPVKSFVTGTISIITTHAALFKSVHLRTSTAT